MPRHGLLGTRPRDAGVRHRDPSHRRDAGARRRCGRRCRPGAAAVHRRGGRHRDANRPDRRHAGGTVDARHRSRHRVAGGNLRHDRHPNGHRTVHRVGAHAPRRPERNGDRRSTTDAIHRRRHDAVADLDRPHHGRLDRSSRRERRRSARSRRRVAAPGDGIHSDRAVRRDPSLRRPSCRSRCLLTLLWIYVY